MFHRSEWHHLPKSMPGDRIAIAIGDVHGRADLLEQMHASLREEIILPLIEDACIDPSRIVVVWLGDYIDRGPDSKDCLDLVAAGLSIPGVSEKRLMGNHEQFVRIVINEDPDISDELKLAETAGLWLTNGGLATLESLDADEFPADPLAFRQHVREALGEHRIALLDSLASHHREGDVIFVHAGISPLLGVDYTLSKSWHEYDHDHWAWIREPFISQSQPMADDVFVVHGHTAQIPEVRGRRAGIDSGAYRTGGLTAALLRENELKFLVANDG